MQHQTSYDKQTQNQLQQLSFLFPNPPTKQNTEPTIPPLLRPQTDKFVRKFGVIISEPDSYNHHRVHPFLESVLINIANEIK